MEFLSVSNKEIVDQKKQPVALRGVNVGGWMNLENFINGYSGSESHLRSLMSHELGKEKAAFFFERLADHFFNEEDIRFLHERGVNLVRLPLNYRHFELDMVPYAYLESGFKRLDQVLDWCEKYNIYVLLDLHAVQGWQNSDWHCDNSSRHSLFWSQKQFQDRFYALWREFARRYHDRAVIAAYNLINEPLSNAPFGRFSSDKDYVPDWENINRIYRQAIRTIREVDENHMIMLEGDYYSVLFSGMEHPEDVNVIFSSHNYINAALSDLPEYPAVIDQVRWDKAQIKKQFSDTEGYKVTQVLGIPLLVGEFGFHNLHASGRLEPQIDAFADQMSIYNACGVHWTFWNYKDIGSMGWVQLDPASPYMKALQKLENAKKALRPDLGWLSGYPGEVGRHVDQLSGIINSFIPMIDPETNKRYFAQAAMSTYTADQLQWLYVEQFVDKTETQIDEILASFSFKNCVHNEDLDRIIAEHLTIQQ